MSLPVPGTGRFRQHRASTGRCDKHRYCTDCSKRRGSNVGNRRVRRAVRVQLRKEN